MDPTAAAKNRNIFSNFWSGYDEPHKVALFFIAYHSNGNNEVDQLGQATINQYEPQIPDFDVEAAVRKDLIDQGYDFHLGKRQPDQGKHKRGK